MALHMTSKQVNALDYETFLSVAELLLSLRSPEYYKLVIARPTQEQGDPQLQKYAKDLVNANKADTEGSIAHIDKVKAELKTTSSWNDLLNKSEADSKAKADQAIANAYKYARERIAELPEDERNKAAEWWVSSCKWLVNFWDKFVDWFARLFGAIVDFLKKVWNVIQNVWNSIVDFWNGF
jgi:hypothetical protein